MRKIIFRLKLCFVRLNTFLQKSSSNLPIFLAYLYLGDHIYVLELLLQVGKF